jgi:DNA-binding transcriptional LysR family regulator
MHKPNLRGLDLNLLVPLQALLEERSVTRAAMRVHLSQPAMSRVFERLREAFSDELLIRSGKKYALTPRAAALLEELTLLLPKVESLWQKKPFSPASATGCLKLAMTDQMAALLLPELVATLSREAPNVDVQIVPWQESSVRDLAAGHLDLVVSPLTAPFPLVVERLLPDRFVCLVSRNHPHRKKSFSLTEYLAEKHIVLEVQPGHQTLVDRPLSELGKRRKSALRLPFFVVAVEALEKTSLVLTIPERLANRRMDPRKTRLVEAPKEIPPYYQTMSWSDRLNADPLHSWFRDCLRATCKRIM